MGHGSDVNADDSEVFGTTIGRKYVGCQSWDEGGGLDCLYEVGLGGRMGGVAFIPK